MWYLTTASYEKVIENGMQKKVSEKYLVDAMSCTEAEARMIEHLKPFVSGELKVISTKEETYTELFIGDGDYFFDVKVDFITLDEKTSKEKKHRSKMLVQAENLESALKVHNEKMKGTLADYWLAGIDENKIIEVLLYDGGE